MKTLKGKEVEFTEKLNQIFTSFAENMDKGVEATSKENVELAKSLHECICQYSFDCSIEAFSGIGYGYKENPEFKSNIDRFAEYLKNFKEIQFTLVTHQKATMEHADVLYGVTMPEHGISKVLSLRLGDDFDIE